MGLIVQKFGGTSVASLERMQQAARHVLSARAQGHDVIVVVSAMAGETDRLITLAQTAQSNPEPREYAALVSTGEQASMALFAMILQAQGCSAKSYTGWQASILTDSHYKNARIADINDKNLREALKNGDTPVVSGFQGIDANHNITTLGRGGSDTTAVAIAAALKADECQIYTDVDGVYTTDPRVVPAAQRLSHITFEEMLELASLGAKVLQIRSVEFAGKYNVPLRVLSTFQPGPGTLITYEDSIMEKALVSGITFNRNEAKLTIFGVPAGPGTAAHILSSISDANIGVDMIIQSASTEDDPTINFSFTVNRDDYQTAQTILQQVMKKLGARKVVGDNKVAKLSVVGVGMRSHPGVASKIFSTLGKEGINIHMITTSEIKVSVLMDEKYLELGVRALHTAFGLDGTSQEEVE